MNTLKGGRAADRLTAIDRNDEKPVYVQLAESLRQQILSGKFQPGEKLPSENMLVETYKVSPMTVRKAVNLLASQNIVNTARGSGTFVKGVAIGSAAFDLNELRELFNDTARTRVKLIDVSYKKADDRIARKLRIKPGERTIFLRRILLDRGEPAFYHQGYLINDTTRPVVEAELEVTDLKGLFQGSGSAIIKNGDLYLEATILNETETDLLGLTPPAPGMMLEHLFYDFNDKPVSWGWFLCSNSRFRLHTRIGIEHIKGAKDGRNK